MKSEWGGAWEGDHDEIRERGRAICERLTHDIASIAPPGIGHWPRAWEITAPADSDFMSALSAWESDPMNEAAKQRVRATYGAVLEAWQGAVAEYHGRGAER